MIFMLAASPFATKNKIMIPTLRSPLTDPRPPVLRLPLSFENTALFT
jgi:hypothetical protein